MDRHTSPICSRPSARHLVCGELLALSILSVLAGQWGTGLVTMDDLREAEVAREMVEGGDYLVPHLAGRPFVEKPPAFQILVALAYTVAGGPSVTAARVVSAAFALLSLAGVFALGRRFHGLAGGTAATVLLATSICFSHTAHVVLLDNALTAVLAWALYFAWRAADSSTPDAKRAWYAAALFAAGLSFLFKGFVGPAIFASGLFGALALTRGWGELRAMAHPVPLAALVAPMIAWILPFVIRAPRELLREFFLYNNLGRAAWAFDSHARPFYYYAVTLWLKFAPGSLLLPFAAAAAWTNRRHSEGRAAAFLLGFAAGPLLLLSLSLAKEGYYLLPAYPALSVLVAVWIVPRVVGPESGPRLLAGGMGAIAALAVLTVIGAGWFLGGPSAEQILVAALATILIAILVVSVSRRRVGAAATATAALLLLTHILCFVPPLVTLYVARNDLRPVIQAILDGAADRELLLYGVDDRLRAGCGFYRGRTVEEVRDPTDLVACLRRNPEAVAVVQGCVDPGHPELHVEAEKYGCRIMVERRIAIKPMRPVEMIRAVPSN
jgi:hypothetical protein